MKNFTHEPIPDKIEDEPDLDEERITKYRNQIEKGKTYDLIEVWTMLEI